MHSDHGKGKEAGAGKGFLPDTAGHLPGLGSLALSLPVVCSGACLCSNLLRGREDPRGLAVLCSADKCGVEQ